MLIDTPSNSPKKEEQQSGNPPNISFVPLKDIKRLPNKDKEEYNEQRGR